MAENTFVESPIIDLSKPPKVAYTHLEFPKMMYHWEKDDPRSVQAIKAANTYNLLHPEATIDVPTRVHLTITVKDKNEEADASAKGFHLKPKDAAGLSGDASDDTGKKAPDKGFVPAKK